MKFLLLTSALILSSCSSLKKKVPVYEIYKPNIIKEEGENTVSVMSSMQLAHNSYVAGCIQQANSTPEGKAKGPHMKKCLKRAKLYISDIEEIMNQDGK